MRTVRRSSYRTTPERCPQLGHPGTTYNHRENRTWCLCGGVQYAGNAAVPHVACCGGPLTEPMGD